MLNRLNLKQPNDVSLVLMKNVREELSDIPVEYVKSITYNLSTYAKIELEIPSHLTRRGLTIDYPLYRQIKGKQQLILSINGQLSKFIIDDQINVVETSKGKIKRLTAFGYEKMLEKKSLLTSQATTYPLYQPSTDKNEPVGILNLFEQQTRWKVGYVDEDTLYEWATVADSTTHLLLNSFKVENVQKLTKLWGRNLNAKTQIQKGKTFTLHQYNLKGTKDNLTRHTQSFHHTFTAEKTIIAIRAYYSSDSTYRFGITYRFTYEDETYDEFKAAYTNIEGFDIEIEKVECIIQSGELVEKQVSRYRYFDELNTQWYSFLNEVSEAYDCVFVFDSMTQTIHCYHKDNYGKDTGLSLTFENGVKEINKKQNLSNIVTRLYVKHSELSIVEENKLGTEYVECFDFYRREGLMSDELMLALDRYDQFLHLKQEEWLSVKEAKVNAVQRLTIKQNELKSAEERLKVEEALLKAYSQAEAEGGIGSEKQQAQVKLVAQIKAEINQLKMTIDGKHGLQAHVDDLQARLVEIGREIQREHATDSDGKIFTDLDLEELEEYTIEGTLETEDYVTAHSLYQHALKTVKDYNDVAIEFTLSVDNLLKRITHSKGWNYLLSVGDRLMVDDEEIRDEDGLVQLSGFTFLPNTFEVTQLNFTNDKDPQDSLKTLRSTARKNVKTSQLTTNWKSVWQDSKSRNAQVADLFENGLDTASIAIRSENELNKIEFNESGIFIQDANQPDKQVALMNGLIATTEDSWESSKVIMDTSGVAAKSIVGALTINEDLFLANDEETVVFNSDGICIKDPVSKKERALLGVNEEDAMYRFYSTNNQLMMSEQGSYQVIPVSATDNFDSSNPLSCDFYLEDKIQSVHEFNLRLKLSKFRGYSKGAVSTPQSATLKTTKEAGALEVTQETTKTLATSNTEHYHTFTINQEAHTHELEFIDEGHSHELEHGIYEFPIDPVVSIYLDDQLVATHVTADDEFDLTARVSLLAKGWHSLKVVGLSTDENPNGLGRATLSAYLSAFIQY